MTIIQLDLDKTLELVKVFVQSFWTLFGTGEVEADEECKKTKSQRKVDLKWRSNVSLEKTVGVSITTLLDNFTTHILNYSATKATDQQPSCLSVKVCGLAAAFLWRQSLSESQPVECQTVTSEWNSLVWNSREGQHVLHQVIYNCDLTNCDLICLTKWYIHQAN